jgi:uncharacterized repeat protein (TIGR01451 family)
MAASSHGLTKRRSVSLMNGLVGCIQAEGFSCDSALLLAGPEGTCGVALGHAQAAARAQVVFIDAAVQDHGALLDGLEPGAVAYVLDPVRDGVQQIAEVLGHHANLSTVSIVAHGTAGSVTLGSARLDAAGLPRHAADLRAIGRAITPGGALQVFACEVAKGPSGRALVQALSQAAGTAVAAASRTLGGAEGGGDWTLDVRSAPGGTAPSLPIAAAALRSYGHALSGAGSPPTGFPLDITDFSASNTGGGSFVTGGNATISGTALQLTPDANQKAGIAVYNQSFSSNLGLSVQFTYNSSGGTGADGLSFFLLNGDTVTSASSVTPGGYGGGLGYSNDAANGAGGITGGFLGVGFDTFGNYAQVDNGQSSSGLSGSTANYVGVRGASNASTPYGWITGAPYSPGIDGQRTVQVNVTKLSATQEQLQVYMEPSGSNNFTKIIDTTVNQALPGSFYFGFAASTGGSDDLHQIDNVSVKLPVNLAFGTATVQDVTTGQANPATLNPGDQFSYSYTLTNSGPNGDGQITVNDALPANIENASWTVTDSAGTHTGTGGAIGVNLLSGATATITVTGTVDPHSTSGNADHTVTVSPGTAYSLANPNEATGVTLNIGPGGSSVSLVGADGAAATTDTGAITPFSSASVVDTFTDPGTGTAPADTLTVAITPSAGALSATGGTYDASTGTLTATGTAVQLQTVLQSVTFTPVAHAASPGTSAAVPITVTVTDPDSQNTTGGGHPSATQTATVTVTAAHDTPVISGAAANQAVGDNATDTPLSTLSVTDPDNTGATASVTITGGAAVGSFTTASSSGWTMTTGGNGDTTYTQAFAAQQDIGAAVQSAVQALVFQPTPLTTASGGSVTAHFTVAVADAVSPSASATDSNTSVTVYDTTPPAPPANLTLAPASDSGVQGDDLTNITEPTVTGTAEAGTTVTLTDGSGSNAVVLGTALVDGTGHWSFAPSAPLADGTHSITATATDEVGNVSPASSALPLTIDTRVPSVTAALLHDTGVSATDGITSDATLTGTAEAGGTVALSEAGHSLGTVVADMQGHWSYTPSGLADGAHTLTATEADAAGNLGTASLSFTLDTLSPVVVAALLHDTGASAADSITSDPTLTGTGEAGSSIALSEGGRSIGTAAVDGTGRWTLTPTGLADGAQTVAVTDTNTAGDVGATQVGFTLDTAPPAAPAGLALAPASDSGVEGDGLTNVTRPTITGTAEAGSTVALYEGSAQLGTALAAADGTWSIATGTLADGLHQLTATATDAAGNPSTTSSAFALTIDTSAPVITAAAVDNPADTVTHAQLLGGHADPNAAVTISEGGKAVGIVEAGANGAWSFDPSVLAPGGHSFVASETDAAGNTGAAPAVSLTVPDPRFDMMNLTSSASGSFIGTDYTGPVSYLQAEYSYTGSDNVVLGARVANVFLHSGAGEDALAAKAGSNVLDGGSGSNWLVGASGADGGHDTFFVDTRGGQGTWDTLLNFHPGDILTLWGYNAGSGSLGWSDDKGAAGYQGATLKVGFGDGSGASALVTFGGLTTSGAHFATMSGTSGGVSYLTVTRTA